MKYFGTQAYSESSQTYKIELISKILILDAWSGSECAFLIVTVNLVLKKKKKKKKKKKETDYRLNRYCNFKFHMIVATGLEQKFDYNIFVWVF